MGNMYTNIPIHEVQNVVKNISQEMKEVIINLLNSVLEQNCIEHNGQWYKQNDVLAMGAPSAILAQVFIHLEHTFIVDI
jgi:hypothetical protein